MAQLVVIVDYGSGNLRSVEKAVVRASQREESPARVEVSNRPDRIAKADRIILPGVGAFSACIAGLQQEDGVIGALEHAVLANARPFLGICVGMQLLAEKSIEFGTTAGLGWIAGSVKRLEPEDPSLPVPNMGWRDVRHDGRAPFAGEAPSNWYYFAHSFYFAPKNASHCGASAIYGDEFCAAVIRDNIVGTQFHPEKSQHAGIAFLERFLRWSP